MTEEQAEAVVRLQLGQLAALEARRDPQGVHELREQIRGYETLLVRRRRTSAAVIRADLEEMRDKYGDDRRTEITDDGGDVDLEDLIEEEPNAVTISHNGYIKRLPLTTYRTQHRGGKGVSGRACARTTSSSTSSSPRRTPTCSASPTAASCYWLKVYEIPQVSRTSAGPVDRQRAVAQAGGEDHERHPGAASSRRASTC